GSIRRKPAAAHLAGSRPAAGSLRNTPAAGRAGWRATTLAPPVLGLRAPRPWKGGARFSRPPARPSRHTGGAAVGATPPRGHLAGLRRVDLRPRRSGPGHLSGRTGRPTMGGRRDRVTPSGRG